MKKSRLLYLVVIFGVLCTLGVGFYFFGWAVSVLGYSTGKATGETVQENGATSSNQSPYEKIELTRLERPLNILVIGLDKASSINGPPRPKPWRSDVIILVRVDPDAGQVKILSIPRDTRANIDGHGVKKINSAYAYGEIPLAQKAVEDFLGLKINHFICIDYVAFSGMVDIMGGIEINVQKALSTKHFNFNSGSQTMNGQQAYVYITDRSEPMADISRIDRQQQFLLALLKNIKNNAGTMELARMYLEFKKSADTSLTLRDTLKLALFVQNLNMDDIVVQTLPGQPAYIDGLSYWIADEEAKQKIVAEMFTVGANAQ